MEVVKKKSVTLSNGKTIQIDMTSVAKFPLELPVEHKRLIRLTANHVVLECPNCKKLIYYKTAPKDDYTHCTTKMIKWI